MVQEVRDTLSRHLTVVSGGGITDVAEITGLSYIDRETKTTRTARAANFGTEASPWRLVLIDDWTRSLPHVLQGLMSIINTGTPASDSASAITESVLVFPVPVAPAMSP